MWIEKCVAQREVDFDLALFIDYEAIYSNGTVVIITPQFIHWKTNLTVKCRIIIELNCSLYIICKLCKHTGYDLICSEHNFHIEECLYSKKDPLLYFERFHLVH